MIYNQGDLCSFISKFQVEKGSEFTHTSIVKPSGAFYIPTEKTQQFHDLYKNAMVNNENIYLTEKHRDEGPILIDLDFRWLKSEFSEQLNRKYNKEKIEKIVTTYASIIFEYIDVESFDAYVMEKPTPVIDKDLVKDGIHIVIPNIITRPSVQYLIRKDLLNNHQNIFEDLKLNNSIDDVIDEAVIERNNWQMYGSKKPNCECYKITHIYKINRNLEMESKDILTDHSQYVEEMSIRNKYEKSNLKIEKVEIINQFDNDRNTIKKKAMAAKTNRILQNTSNFKRNTYGDHDIVNKLVDILSEKRATDYQEWIRVGWCLRTIDYRLLDTWNNFSKKSSKFVEGECDRIWNYMKEDGLNIGTLHMWAKEDNPEKYRSIMLKDLTTLIFKSRSATHHDIAVVIHHMYKSIYVCASIKNNFWYEFRNHKWCVCDSGHSLRALISTHVCKEYLLSAAFYNNKAAAEDDESDQQRFAQIGKQFSDIALKLKTAGFKDNIMKECRELFFEEKFEEKLDSKSHLIGFENGVYDLAEFEFRNGMPEDFVSYSTKINYIPYDEDSKTSKEIADFLSKVLVKPQIKEYVLTVLASFLNGGIKEERFHIWTGSGCFAKNTPIMMSNGSIEYVQDIKVGDRLMGDDSTPRIVQELFHGYSDMYLINFPSGIGGFTVNGQHDLVLKATDCMFLDMNNNKISWIELVENSTSLLKIVERKLDSIDDIYPILEHLDTNERFIKYGDILHMSVLAYIKLPDLIKSRLVMYTNDSCIEFENSEESFIEPYFAGSIAVKKSFVPEQTKYTSRFQRLQFLAGIVDSIGVEYGREWKIKCAAQLIIDIAWICQSLAICYTIVNDTEIILGYGCEGIPLRSKKILSKKYRPDGLNNQIFTITRVEDDQFYGFELDGNKRFLLDNFVVVKNSNGKSKTIDLFEQSFGDYCCKLPISLLTQKRVASNAATSEIARTKGKRFACLQEPSEDEKLNVGLMKELTGGDKIQARLLFKEPIEFKPQFKMILTCNQLPNVPSDDGGTWRRIRVVEFTSKFCDNPVEANEFGIDTSLSDKFQWWKEAFMALLLEYYKNGNMEHIKEPEEVLKCTREYQKNNDVFLEYFEQNVEKHDSSFLLHNDVVSRFKAYCKDNRIQVSSTFLKGKELKTNLIKHLGVTTKVGNKEIYTGWRYKDSMIGGEDDDL